MGAAGEEKYEDERACDMFGYGMQVRRNVKNADECDDMQDACEDGLCIDGKSKSV